MGGIRLDLLRLIIPPRDWKTLDTVRTFYARRTSCNVGVINAAGRDHYAGGGFPFLIAEVLIAASHRKVIPARGNGGHGSAGESRYSLPVN